MIYENGIKTINFGNGIFLEIEIVKEGRLMRTTDNNREFGGFGAIITTFDLCSRYSLARVPSLQNATF